jgi:hypothetical protein
LIVVAPNSSAQITQRYRPITASRAAERLDGPVPEISPDIARPRLLSQCHPLLRSGEDNQIEIRHQVGHATSQGASEGEGRLAIMA